MTRRLPEAGEGEETGREEASASRAAARTVVAGPAASAPAMWRDASDRELVLAIRAGSDRALDELFARFRPLLVRQARRARAGAGEADDFALDLLVRTAARLSDPRVAIPDSLAAWLAGALRHRLANARRDRARRDRLHREASDDSWGAGERVVAAACSEATLRASRGADWETPPAHPAVVLLQRALIAGLTDAEQQLLLWDHHRIPKRVMAEWLGIGYEAAKQRIRRLRLRLRATALRFVDTLDERDRRIVEHYVGLAPRLAEHAPAMGDGAPSPQPPDEPAGAAPAAIEEDG